MSALVKASRQDGKENEGFFAFSGMDLREFLPPSEKLLEAAELGDLRHKANFQYLIKAGYEQVQRILS